MPTKNTIIRKGHELVIRKEVTATEVITPGMLVNHAGAADGLLPHKRFALENDLIGRGINDNYAVGEVVQVGVCNHGVEVWALLANTENAAVGDRLVSNAAGTLEVIALAQTPLEEVRVVGFALEALNNTSGAPARILIEVA